MIAGLYAASLEVRPALAFDSYVFRMEWRSEHRGCVVLVVVSQSSCFTWIPGSVVSQLVTDMVMSSQNKGPF